MAKAALEWDPWQDPAREGCLAPVVQAFADAHNLLLRRHETDLLSWSLCFSHPQGGRARIEISYWPGDAFRVVSRWWQDDYDSYSRRIRQSGRWPYLPIVATPFVEKDQREMGGGEPSTASTAPATPHTSGCSSGSTQLGKNLS